MFIIYKIITKENNSEIFARRLQDTNITVRYIMYY